MKVLIACIIVVFISIKTNAQNAVQSKDSSTVIRLRCGPVTIKSSPLYLVDGKVADSTCIKTLDADVIKSVSIIKDKAAETLYGKEAANGVIIIETKRSSLFQ